MDLYFRNGRFELDTMYCERAVPKSAGFFWDPKLKRWWTDSVDKADRITDQCRVDESATQAFINSRDLKSRLYALSSATESDFEVPCPEGLEYYPFQKVVAEYASCKNNLLISDVMGLGKSIESAAIINSDPSLTNILIIAPSSLKINWKREMETWLVNPYSICVIDSKTREVPKNGIYIINYDIIHKFKKWIDTKHWDLLICDEAHFLKNSTARRTQMVFGKWDWKRKSWEIAPIEANRKAYLTGTPILNKPVELWPILKSLDFATWHNWEHFVTRYCDGVQDRFGWNVDGASNTEELQRILKSTIMVRRTKEEVLKDLPPKVHQIIEFPQNGLHSAIEKEKRVLENLSKVKGDKISLFEELSRIRHETALAKVPLMIDHLTSVFEQVNKAVFFCHHKDVLQKVVDALGVSSVVVTGDVSERQPLVDAFQQGDIQLFAATIGAAGVGLTLTAASTVVFGELDWVPANMAQAEDRLHRIGQESSVLVQYLVLEDSIDAHIAQALTKKQDVIDAVLG